MSSRSDSTTPTTVGWRRPSEPQPFGRLVKPLEVAKAVAFMLSDRSGLMTGSIIDYDQHIVGTA